ncbi:hypothetical protein ACS0TY_025934 [Phlomoides rotata]
MEPILEVPPYLVGGEVESTRPTRRSSATREDAGASGSRSQRRRSSAGPHDFTAPHSVPTSHGGAYTGHGQYNHNIHVSQSGAGMHTPYQPQFTAPHSVPTSHGGAYTGHGVSQPGADMHTPYQQLFTAPQSVPTSYGGYPVHDVSTSAYDNANDYVPQPGADMHTPNQQYDPFAPTMQTSSFMSMFDFDSNAYQRGDLGRRPNYNPSPIPFYSTGVNTEQINPTKEEWDEDVPINLPRRSQRDRWPTHCCKGGHKWCSYACVAEESEVRKEGLHFMFLSFL